jgi:hypothetical protein
VCTWSRSFPDEPGADVWVEADDRIVDGRVVRSAPRIMMFEPASDGLDAAAARQLAAELLNAADTLDKLTA